MPADALRQPQRARQARQQVLRVGGVGGQARAPVRGQVGGGDREPPAAQRDDEREAQRGQLGEGPPGGRHWRRRGVRGAFQPVLPELGPGHQPQQPQRVQGRREHDGPADAVMTGDGGFHRVDGEHRRRDPRAAVPAVCRRPARPAVAAMSGVRGRLPRTPAPTGRSRGRSRAFDGKVVIIADSAQGSGTRRQERLHGLGRASGENSFHPERPVALFTVRPDLPPARRAPGIREQLPLDVREHGRQRRSSAVPCRPNDARSTSRPVRWALPLDRPALDGAPVAAVAERLELERAQRLGHAGGRFGLVRRRRVSSRSSSPSDGATTKKRSLSLVGWPPCSGGSTGSAMPSSSCGRSRT